MGHIEMHYQNPIRINLKTNADDRKALIDYCLNEPKQYVAIGWSDVYKWNPEISDYKTYYHIVEESVRKSHGRLNHALNLLWFVEEGDLFWTRDLDGYYWICRAISGPLTLTQAGIKMPVTEEGNSLDIGAVVPVKAYRYGITVPGAIKASFNRAQGGIAEEIRGKLIPEYSQYIYNRLSHSETYQLSLEELRQKSSENIIDNLPDFELEELVISYLQIRYNYYLLSNSIANKSTTIKIEGELRSRDPKNPGKAVVQVKGPKIKETLSGNNFKDYLDKGYVVFLYADQHCDACGLDSMRIIEKKDLQDFYKQYKTVLPESITDMENLFGN